MMTNISRYMLLLIGLICSSCFDEEEFSVTNEVDYLAFADAEASVLEGEDAAFTLRVFHSGPSLHSAISLPVNEISLEGIAAVEGVDYTLSSNLEGLSIPAGEHFVDVTVTIIDNDQATGPRQLVLQLGETANFDIGYLGTEQGRTFTLTIREDDAITFGYSSFEEPAAGEVNNYPSQDGVDQVNVAGENSVDFIATGGEMGFNTSYVPGEEGGADSGLLFGVSKFTSDEDWGYDTGGFTDGSQAYSTSDADGLMEIVFDQLTIPEETEILQVSLDLWFADESWEEDDEIDLLWRTSGGDELILSLRSDGASMTDSPDGTGNVIVDQWTSFVANVTGIETGSLVIQIGTDSGSEIAFIDNIVIKGI